MLYFKENKEVAIVQEKLELSKSNGTTETLDIVSSFIIKNKDGEKKYMLLTANEVDQNGLIKILASEVVDKTLVKIESEDDWMNVKNAMRAIISSSTGDYTYCNFGSNLSYSSDIEYARVIAIQDVAKQQLITDFIEKRPNYTEEEQKEQEEVPVEDPNAIIYPTDSEEAPKEDVSDEVIPGISELTGEEAEAQENTEEAPLASEIINPLEEEPVVNVIDSNEEAPIVDNSNNPSNSARDIMVNKIVMAVDEYIRAIKEDETEMEINALKTSIASLSEEINKLHESLKTQE